MTMQEFKALPPGTFFKATYGEGVGKTFYKTRDGMIGKPNWLLSHAIDPADFLLGAQVSRRDIEIIGQGTPWRFRKWYYAPDTIPEFVPPGAKPDYSGLKRRACMWGALLAMFGGVILLAVDRFYWACVVFAALNTMMAWLGRSKLNLVAAFVFLAGAFLILASGVLQ